MKNQYTSDINDYITYGVLRILFSTPSIRPGVFWMMTADDGRTDGRKLGYLEQPDRWRGYDPELFDLMGESVRTGQRTIAFIESSGILPGTRFCRATIPDDAEQREIAMARGLASLSDCDLLFFAQDNGLEVASIPRGRKRSCKYLYFDEITRAWDQGHSLLLYQHFPRTERGPYLALRAAQLMNATGVLSIRAATSAHNCFFLLSREVHAPLFTMPLEELAGRWQGVLTIHHLSPAAPCP